MRVKYLKNRWFLLVGVVAALSLALPACNVDDTATVRTTNSGEDSDPDAGDDGELEPDAETDPEPDADTDLEPEGAERSASVGLQGGAAETSSSSYNLQIQMGTESAVQSESPSYRLVSPNAPTPN